MVLTSCRWVSVCVFVCRPAFWCRHWSFIIIFKRKLNVECNVWTLMIFLKSFYVEHDDNEFCIKLSFMKLEPSTVYCLLRWCEFHAVHILLLFLSAEVRALTAEEQFKVVVKSSYLNNWHDWQTVNSKTSCCRINGHYMLTLLLHGFLVTWLFS